MAIQIQPGRIDAIWMSKSLLGSPRAPTDLRCHVDQDQRLLCRSDHRLVLSYLPFQKVFDAPAGKVRTEQRSAAIPTLNISHLYGAEETTAFHRRLNVHILDSGFAESLDEFVSTCTCRPQPPPDMWPHPKPGAVSAVDVTATPEHSPCSCTISGPPADAQSLLDKLGDKLQSIFIDSVDQPDPRLSKKKPRGYKFRASRLSNLYSRLARLRRHLAHVSNEASLLEAKSDWRVILNTAPVIDNLRLPPWRGSRMRLGPKQRPSRVRGLRRFLWQTTSENAPSTSSRRSMIVALFILPPLNPAHSSPFSGSFATQYANTRSR